MSTNNNKAAVKVTYFQQFVEANQGLLECYNKVKLEDYKKMGEVAKENVCASQKEKLKEILASNQLVMANLVEQRIELLYKFKNEETSY